MKKYLLAFSTVYYLLSISCLYAAGIHSRIIRYVGKLDKEVLEKGGGSGSTNPYNGTYNFTQTIYDDYMETTNTNYGTFTITNGSVSGYTWNVDNGPITGTVSSSGNFTGTMYFLAANKTITGIFDLTIQNGVYKEFPLTVPNTSTRFTYTLKAKKR